MQKVHELMVQLKTLINSLILGEKTSLCLDIRNDTRWSSTYSTLVQYNKLYPYISTCNFSESTKRKIPRLSKNDEILQLTDSLKNVMIVRNFFKMIMVIS